MVLHQPQTTLGVSLREVPGEWSAVCSEKHCQHIISAQQILFSWMNIFWLWRERRPLASAKWSSPYLGLHRRNTAKWLFTQTMVGRPGFWWTPQRRADGKSICCINPSLWGWRARMQLSSRTAFWEHQTTASHLWRPHRIWVDKIIHIKKRKCSFKNNSYSYT